MRQIGDEYRVDPFKAIGTAAVESGNYSKYLEQEHATHSKNTFNKRAHQFCTNKVVDLNSPSFSKAEAAAFTNCVNQYAASVSLFSAERSAFLNRLSQMKSRGEDVFASVENQ